MFESLYPMIPRNRFIYHMQNNETRIGTDDNDIYSIMDSSKKWYRLLKLLDGEHSVRQVYDLYHPQQCLSFDSYRKVLAKLEKIGAVTFLSKPFHELDEYEKRKSDFTLYYGKGVDGEKTVRWLQGLTVAVLGSGVGGCLIALELAELGVGSLKIVDPDIVDLQNLDHQLVYTQEDVGHPKVLALQKHINSRCKKCQVQTSVARIHNVADALAEVNETDWVFCCMDEPPYVAQRIVNRACYIKSIPSLYAFSSRDSAKAFIVDPDITGCADCLLSSEAANGLTQLVAALKKADFSPITPTNAVSAAIEASWIVQKWLQKCIFNTASGGILYRFDFDAMQEDKFVHFQRDSACPTCGRQSPPNNSQRDLWKLISIESQGTNVS
ncbi:HesA/MoeB/ThiF family protein [Bifidobacterium sp.]|uniref:HesA/MoeB/ThiF family protein n=2 Tax=Bifidobacterium sp. TaxID=41200 RepID=UPI0025B7E2A6|nr:ThiF family adenylyltransferase [Bifidobacterium sp.]MCI1224961.1 ThiF family adenylyltransferase [Bifidobacterium sp.]